jgi:hypothetical protein
MPFIKLSRFNRRTATLAAVAAVAGAFGAMPSAPAMATPLSTHVFSYADMPDIDQERIAGNDASGTYHVGLPNGGQMYCGPTSAMDALAFIADHGATSLSPGSHAWDAAGNYETMTSKLNEMGADMSIDYKKGVTQPNFEAGLTTWNAQYGYKGHTFGFVSEFPGDGDDWQAPNLGIATLAEAFGNPVVVRIGYYKSVSYTQNGTTVNALQRTGGHFVAMTGFDNSGLNFMDPADEAGAVTQSAYTNRTQAVSPTTAVFLNSSGTPLRSNLQTETYLHMPNYAGGAAYVEGYTVIQPSFQLTAKRNILQILRNSVVVRTIKFPIAATVSDAQLSPAGDSAYYALNGKKTIYKINLSTGATTPLTKVAAPVTSLAVSTTGDRVFAAAGRTVNAVSNTGTQIAKTTLPSTVAAVAFDPVRGQVDAVTPQSKAVSVLNATLKPQGSVTLPASAIQKAGDVDATVNPATGQLTIKATGLATTTVGQPIQVAATQPAVNPAATSVANATINQPASTSATQVAATATNVVNAPVSTVPVQTTANIPSLVTAPVIHVTPITTVASKSPLGAMVLHGAVARKASVAPVAATTAIVRNSISVPQIGAQPGDYNA